MTSRLKNGVFYIQEKSGGWDDWNIVDNSKNLETAKSICRTRAITENLDKNKNYQVRVSTLDENDNELTVVFSL